MTNHDQNKYRKDRWIDTVTRTAGVCSLTLCMLLTGCSGDDPVEEETVYTPPSPPPAPVQKAPKVTPIVDLMAQHRIDQRIIWDESNAPANDDARMAVLTFFDGFARGDHVTLRPMLSLTDQIELEDMISDGVWDEATKNIDVIQVYAGDSDFGPAVVAIIQTDNGGAYQPQMWYYQFGDQPSFEAAPTPPDMMDRLIGPDFVASWLKILQEELELADMPDDDVKNPQVLAKEAEEEESNDSSGAGGQNPGRRSPGGGGPGRRRPKGAPRKAPGIR